MQNTYTCTCRLSQKCYYFPLKKDVALLWNKLESPSSKLIRNNCFNLAFSFYLVFFLLQFRYQIRQENWRIKNRNCKINKSGKGSYFGLQPKELQPGSLVVLVRTSKIWYIRTCTCKYLLQCHTQIAIICWANVGILLKVFFGPDVDK